MILVGLTGSIGMGKSTVAQMFADEGVPAYNADDAVHAMYRKGGAAVASVGKAFPGVVIDGAIDRERLSKDVLNNAGELARLEAIVHPLVGALQMAFLQTARDAGAPLVVLDIPLLFETGGEKRVDVTVVVSAPAVVQRARVLARPGMTAEKFEAILAKQTPDAEKRARANFTIDTGGSLEATRAQVKAVLKALKKR